MYTPTHAGLEFMLQVPMLNILSCQIWLVLEFVISCILFPKSDSTWFHWNICMWCACLLLVLLLFTSLDICFWNSELNCYIVIIHFLSVVCSLLVSSWLTILFCPNWIFFFCQHNEGINYNWSKWYVLCLSFTCDFSVLHTLVWLGIAQFGTFCMSWRQSSVFKCQI